MSAQKDHLVLRNYSFVNISTRNLITDWVISGIPIIVLFVLHPSQLGKLGVINGKAVALILLLVFTYFGIKLIKIGRPDFYQLALVTQIFYFALCEIFIEGNAQLFTIGNLFSILIFYSIIRSDVGLIKRSARLYVWIMCAISIGAVIGVLGFYTGYFSQQTFFTNENGRELYLIGTSLTTDLFGRDGMIVRPVGIFDEPGQFAVHLIFALILNYVLGCNRKYEAVLIVGMLTTLSLGGFVALFIYILSLRLNLRDLKVKISVTILITMLFFIYSANNEYFTKYLLNRGSSLFTESNRDTGYQYFFNNFNSIGFFGTDEVATGSFNDAVTDATAFGTVVRYGFIGSLFANLHIFIFMFTNIKHCLTSINKKARLLLPVSCIIISILYHRPFVLMFSFYFLILMTQRLLLQRSVFVTCNIK